MTVLVAFYNGNHGLALYAAAIWIALIAITLIGDKWQYEESQANTEDPP